jgi:perosamine synthetase
VNIPFGMPLIGPEERNAVDSVLRGHILVHGPRATDFEAAFAAWTGAAHSVSVSSCTAGLHLVWFCLGLGPGDEVIVPAQTHVATAHAVELTGARPVFVDAEPRTGNIDATAIAAAITPRTRGISVVHFLGHPVDMVPIMALARTHGLFVLEDCALAIGTRLDGVHAGLLGDAGVFSFYPVKHMTTAEGGMVITRDGKLAADLRLKRAFGVDRTVHERTVPGVYDVVALGFNYRMNELEAALGIEQLRKMDGFLAVRERNWQALRAALSGVDEISQFDEAEGRCKSSRYCLSVLLAPPLAKRRAEIVTEMKAQGVGTSVYYPKPVPAMTYYRERYALNPQAFPHALRISDASIALSVGPHLKETDMQTIAAGLMAALRKVTA